MSVGLGSRRINVAFVLGAGISRDLLPLSGELDHLVLTSTAADGRMVVRGTDSLYHLQPRGLVGVTAWTPRVRSFLGWLVEWLGDEEHDYEALYFACQQVADDLASEHENPLLRPFIKECLEEAPSWRDNGSHDWTTDPRPPAAKLHELTREAQNYIAGAVAGALTVPKPTGPALSHLHGPLLEALKDRNVGRIDIITLNHDVLLEASLRQAGISVEDGFRPAPHIPGVDRWVGYAWSRSRPARLIKLHGSVDWWEIWTGGERRQLVRLSGYPFRLEDHFGVRWDTPDQRPRMLVGTTNKTLEYLQPFNLDRLAVFRRSLMRCDGLVVSGYSFRDKGVNTLLIDWCWSRRCSLAVVGPDLTADPPPRKARPAMKRTWQYMHDQGRLLPLGTTFADAPWATIRSFLAAGVRR